MRCPICQSRSIVKNGTRKLRFETIQTYQCKQCNKRFQQRKIPHKTYKPQVLYTSLVLYYQGNSLDAVRRQVNKRFKIHVGVSTIFSWIKEYKYLCPIHQIRHQFYQNNSIIFRKRFDHENLKYEYLFHDYKLTTQVKPLFPGLYRYLQRFIHGCPNEFFEIGKRCSQPSFNVKVPTYKTNNLACKMTEFSVQASVNNYVRHTNVELFMIVSDLATIACEVPVWYWEKQVNNGITGHIDILQVRNGLVYILDYKPDAIKQKNAANQLYHYALALSFRTRLPMKSIRCAWFDEHDYIEFSPSNVEIASSH